MDLPLNKGDHPTNLTAYLERSPYGEVRSKLAAPGALHFSPRRFLQFALELIATVFAVLLDSVGVRQGKFCQGLETCSQ